MKLQILEAEAKKYGNLRQEVGFRGNLATEHGCLF